MNIAAPFLTLLQLALLTACIVIELHPRIRTGTLACIVTGLIATVTLIRLGSPATLAEYLIDALLLAVLTRYAILRRNPHRPFNPPLPPRQITP